MPTTMYSVCILLFCSFSLVVGVVHHGYEYEKDVKKNNTNDRVSHANELATDCENFLAWLQYQMLQNLSDILRGDAQLTHLTKSLVLERSDNVSIDRVDEEDELQKLKEPDKAGFGYVPLLLVKKVIGVLKSHNLRWKVLRNLDVRIFHDKQLGGRMNFALEVTNRESRTFGGPRKRFLIMLLLPMMFKMGVMMTMLAGLVVLTLKSLTIGVVLLSLAVGNLLGKKDKYHGGWSRGPQDIHVHLHHGDHHEWQHDDHHHKRPHPVHHYHGREWMPPADWLPAPYQMPDSFERFE